MSRRIGQRSVVAVLVGLMLLSGCAVGPDFRRPDEPNTKEYLPTPLPEKTGSAPVTGGGEQKFIAGQDTPEQWWTVFHSKKLDEIIRMALADSPSMAAAQATVREARENLSARMGAVFAPAVDGALSANRQKMTGAVMGQENALSNTFSLYNASVNVSYTFDLFGGGRREIEALEAKVNYQQFQFEAARLALTANIVTTAVKEASLRAQIQATREIVAAQEQQLAIVEQQYELGGVSRSDVLAQQTQVAVARATLPPLEKGLAQTRHQLAVLAGKFPSEASTLPEFTLEDLTLPQDLPVSLPSSLVRQRPDIQASEALLHAASAQIGVATANMYPRITLSGSLGSEALKLSSLFGAGTGVWSLGAGLLQPLFHGGELSARRRAAIAAYDGAAAHYRLTVLQAFQNVADVLRALDSDAASLKAQAEAAASARESLAISQKQFDLGSVSYLSVLNAQRQYQLTSVSLAQAQAARVADTAALFQALGGGWWNRGAADEKAATDKTGYQR